MSNEEEEEEGRVCGAPSLGGGVDAREADIRIYLTESVYNVALQKSIPA